MQLGVERAPVYPSEPEQPWTSRQEESVMAFELVEEHLEWARQVLGLGSSDPELITPSDIEARRQELKFNKSLGHRTARSVHEIGSLILATVSQVEEDFRQRTVLDIGAGEGRFGEAIARRSKARVTFVDNDPDILAGISKRAGEVVKADGRQLPFDDESFDRVLCAFSSLYWAGTPVETAQALNEALRVTNTSGSLLLVPLLSNMSTRHTHLHLAQEHPEKFSDIYAINELKSLKVWTAQDCVIIESLLELARSGYCAITWSDQITQKGPSISVEHCSAVIDKLKPIPPELLARNLTFAESLMQAA